MKRFSRCAAALLLIGAFCLQGITASAVDDQTVYGGSQATMLSTGNVKMSASLITASVPTRIDFEIDPNKSGSAAFWSHEGVVSVVSNNNLHLQLLGIKAADGTSAKVVSPDHFENWDDLSVEETTAHIALGLKTSQGTIWSPPEADNSLAESCGYYDLSGYAMHRIYLDAKYGRAWPEDTTLNYILYLRLASAE